jgi:hypothetical protein
MEIPCRNSEELNNPLLQGWFRHFVASSPACRPCDGPLRRTIKRYIGDNMFATREAIEKTFRPSELTNQQFRFAVNPEPLNREPVNGYVI